MNTREHIDRIKEMCEYILVEEDLKEIESKIEKLKDASDKFMNRLRGYKLVKASLTWDAKIDVIEWKHDEGFDMDDEGYIYDLYKFKLDNILIVLETQCGVNWIQKLNIKLKINKYEYTEKTEKSSTLDHKEVKRIVRKAKVDKGIPLAEFLIKFLTSLDNYYFEIYSEEE